MGKHEHSVEKYVLLVVQAVTEGLALSRQRVYLSPAHLDVGHRGPPGVGIGESLLTLLDAVEGAQVERARQNARSAVGHDVTAAASNSSAAQRARVIASSALS